MTLCTDGRFWIYKNSIPITHDETKKDEDKAKEGEKKTEEEEKKEESKEAIEETKRQMREATRKHYAAKPMVHVEPGLGRMTFGWDLAKDKFIIKINGIPHEHLKKDPNASQGPLLIMNNSQIVFNGKNMEMREHQWSPAQLHKQIR